jgi:beta-glucanase (GH16 family)
MPMVTGVRWFMVGAVAVVVSSLALVPALADIRGDDVVITGPGLWDDFSGADLDRSLWSFEVTGQNFSTTNREQQAYVDSSETLYIDHDDAATGAVNGALAIHPRYRPGFRTPAGETYDFISSRITTRHVGEYGYGSYSARMKLPAGSGLWPAFWALGINHGQVGWPACGEIDIMENIGRPEWTSAGIHGPNVSGLGGQQTFATATGWHVYRVDRSNQGIAFFVDDREFKRITRAQVEAMGTWVFDQPEYLLLNLALGGVWPYSDNRTTAPYYGLPQSTVDGIAAGNVRALVDWVSVSPAVPAARRTQPEYASWRNGVDVEPTTDTDGGFNIGGIDNGDFVAFNARDFADGVTGVKVRVASAVGGGQIQFRLGGPTATPFVTFDVGNTGGWQSWQTLSASLPTPPTGVHRLFMTFSSNQPGAFVNVNWFELRAPWKLPSPRGGG